VTYDGMIFTPRSIKENICKKLVGRSTNIRKRRMVRQAYLPLKIRNSDYKRFLWNL